MATAASHDPHCRWRIIITDGDGRAIATSLLRQSPPQRDGSGRPPSDSVLSQLTLIIPTTDLTLSQTGLPGTGDLGPDLTTRLLAAARSAREAARGARPSAATDGTPGCSHQGATPSYRVPPRLRRYLQARDQTCRNPICRQPAHKCDIDHTIPWQAGGLTCPCNTGPFCRRDHQLKQLAAWHVAQPHPGTYVWTTPAGLTYTVVPDPHPL